MSKLEEQFIPLKESFDMKELGFEDDCLAIHSINLMTENEDWELKIGGVWKNQELVGSIKAPMYSQCFDFFRKKYNLYSEINLDSYKKPYSLKVTIKHLDDTNTFVDKEYYPYSNGIGDIDNKKYEEAEQACIDKLIEVCKNK